MTRRCTKCGAKLWDNIDARRANLNHAPALVCTNREACGSRIWSPSEADKSEADEGRPDDYDSDEWYGEDDDDAWDDAEAEADTTKERRAIRQARRAGAPTPIKKGGE